MSKTMKKKGGVSNKLDINIEQISYNRYTKNPDDEFDDLVLRKLVLKITPSENIDFDGTFAAFVNMFRTVALDLIPTYIFTTESIKILENTSVYNNDEIRLRISSFMVPDIEVPVKYLAKEFWPLNSPTYVHTNKDPEDTVDLQMYFKAKNTHAHDILNVTTNNAEIKLNNQPITPFSKNQPPVVVRLRPGESFIATMAGVLGVGRVDGLWSASHCYYGLDDENKHCNFSIDSLGQMDEYEIMRRACHIIKAEYSSIRSDVIDLVQKESNKKKSDSNLFKLLVDNRVDNFILVLGEFIQDNPRVIAAGSSKSSFFDDSTILSIYSPEVEVAIEESINRIIELVNIVEQQINTLDPKYNR